MKTYEQRTQEVRGKIRSRRARRRNGFLAAGLCVCLLAAVLFVPYDASGPDVSAYQDSLYYSTIQKLSEYFYEEPAYRNNYEALAGMLKNAMLNMQGALSGGVGGDEYTGSIDFMPEDGEPSYREITDNQVDGVIEGGRIKRSDQYLYYLYGSELRIYTIGGEASAQVGAYDLAGTDADSYYYWYDAEMYLSQDCKTITVIMPMLLAQDGVKQAMILVQNLDVSDPGSIVPAEPIYITGEYLSSRMVGGKLMVVSQYWIDSDWVAEDAHTFVPSAGTLDDMQCIDADSILVPDSLTSSRYTVVTMFDGETLALEDSAALLCYSTELYVSAQHIYATRTYSESAEEDGTVISRSMTEIACLDYSGDTLEYIGAFSLEGTVNNQYSMDEQDGVLRVVTQTMEQTASVSGSGSVMTQDIAAIVTNANLTCVRVGDWTVLAQVVAFAPEGETVESVRFDGDYAYVCTAQVVYLTDPVYFFDLSDLDNITWKDTGTIDGFSSSLVDFGNGDLLGIGYSDSWGLKVEVYRETEEGVGSIAAFELETSFCTEYKSYLIDREDQIVGIPTWDGYLLLQFDGYALHKLALVPMAGDAEQMRGVVIDGYLYVLGSEFQVVSLAG